MNKFQKYSLAVRKEKISEAVKEVHAERKV